jgi:hypothetical protein
MEVDVDIDVGCLIDAISRDELEAIYEDLFIWEFMRPRPALGARPPPPLPSPPSYMMATLGLPPQALFAQIVFNSGLPKPSRVALFKIQEPFLDPLET